MGVIAAFFARLLRMCPGRLFTGFLLIRQEVRAMFKTCNQLTGNWLRVSLNFSQLVEGQSDQNT
jgi:hypothetical protein